MKAGTYIIQASLWVGYIIFSALCFPMFNSDVAFAALALLAISSWYFGRQHGFYLIIVLEFYHYLLFDYYSDIYIFYQTKAFGTACSILITLIAGHLRTQRDTLKRTSEALNTTVSDRTCELQQMIEKLIDDDEQIRAKTGTGHP